MEDDNMKRRESATCPHISQPNILVDVQKVQPINTCYSCDYSGANLWICLYVNCLAVGCSASVNDHGTEHFERNNDHCVHINASSLRAWCYKCDCEVFPQQQSFMQMDPFVLPFTSLSGSCSDNDSDMDNYGTPGLVGMQNIANTCYLNAALQALSNIQPMTHYFLSCSDIIDHAVQNSKVDLAKSYSQLIRDIWYTNGKKIAYLVPRRVLYSMRIVYPMFRGFQQHDTQEFLRCFMDQLHEELKEQTLMNTIESGEGDVNAFIQNEVFRTSLSTASSSTSVSDTNYETCDDSSSLSEELNMFRDKAHMRGVLRTYNTQVQAENGKKVLKVVRSIISDTFDGKLLSSVQCLTCDRLSTREETFQDLSLPIPSKHFPNRLHRSHSMSMQSLNSIDSTLSTQSQVGGWISWMWNVLRSWIWGPSVTLYDCMASFFSADELKGDNMYSCEKCNKLRTGIKYVRILNLPEVLCIHLKRFHHDMAYSCKISRHVQFPLEGFDMRPYLNKNCASLITTYDLVSVICHHGSVGSGHYTCFARNALNERWYEYDDHRVTEVSPDTVRNSQAYVLFYSKRNPQMEWVRTEAMDLSASHPPDTTDMRFYITREWISRFYTFAEPGPINNWTILCPHGGILPSKMPLSEQIAVPISQPLWDYLSCKFGGGPVLNLLFECKTCMRAAEELERRQHFEMSLFSRYNAMEFTLETDAIYAISMPWLRKWQQFAKGVTSVEPGPITNASLINKSNNNAPTHIRMGADYAQINSFLWKFLHEIYGGGPEIILRGGYTADKLRTYSQNERERPFSPDGVSNRRDTETVGVFNTKDNEETSSNCEVSSTIITTTKPTTATATASSSTSSTTIPTEITSTTTNTTTSTTTTNDDIDESESLLENLNEKNHNHAHAQNHTQKVNKHSLKNIQKPKLLIPRTALRKRAKRCALSSKRSKYMGKGNVFLVKDNDMMENITI